MPSTNSRKPCTKCWRDISPSVTTVDAGVLLLLQREQRRVGLRGGELIAGEPPLRPQLVRLGEPGRFRQAAGDGGREHAFPLDVFCVSWASNHTANRSGARASRRPSCAAPCCGRMPAGPRGDSAAHCAAPRAGRAPRGGGAGLRSAGTPAPISFGACCRHWASTAASSIAIAAPCARNGSTGWAASPRSVTGPSPPRDRRTVEQRPFLPALRQRKQRARLGRERCEARQQVVALSVRAPARLVPRVGDDRDDVDEPAALDRVMDQMRIAPEPERSDRRAELAVQAIGRHDGAPCGALREARRRAVAEPRAQGRPQPVGADQRDAVFVARAAAACVPRPSCRANAARSLPRARRDAARCRRSRRPRSRARPADRRGGSPSRARRSAPPHWPSGMRAIGGPSAPRSRGPLPARRRVRRSRSPRPSAIRMRVALGESWMPAPASSSRGACSSTTERYPARASASAAVSPPIPAPAMMMEREAAMRPRVYLRLSATSYAAAT